MIHIKILKNLRDEIYKTFKGDSIKVYTLIKSLEKNPNKGDILGHVGIMSIRELKYDTFRFYFIVNGHELYLFNHAKLEELLITFVRMSKKKNQQRTINEITRILKKVTDYEFD